jgi:glycosyltransferase involved in cell wall biosynthesis
MTARRILISMHDFARGGTERIVIGLARDWARSGREVAILCGSEQGGLRDTVDEAVKVIALTPQITRGFLSRLRLGRAFAPHVRAFKPDVIFLPGNFHALLAGGLRAADPPPAIALKISNPPVPKGVPFARTVFHHITRAVDGFAAMNSGLARELKDMLPGRNIVTLHDPVYLTPVARDLRPDGAAHILWIGRLEPQKDPELALQVLAAMTAPARLTMLGEGRLENSVRRRIAQMGLTERVTLTGHVAQIEPYLAQAEALLITSRYEGGPAVAVEALVQGVPVVSTDCSFLLQDLITCEEAGRIIASRDPAALAAALTQVSAVPRAPEKLRALTAAFAPRTCAQAYLDWFDGLAGHG